MPHISKMRQELPDDLHSDWERSPAETASKAKHRLHKCQVGAGRCAGVRRTRRPLALKRRVLLHMA